jgi:hypothetical protein
MHNLHAQFKRLQIWDSNNGAVIPLASTIRSLLSKKDAGREMTGVRAKRDISPYKIQELLVAETLKVCQGIN